MKSNILTLDDLIERVKRIMERYEDDNSYSLVVAQLELLVKTAHSLGKIEAINECENFWLNIQENEDGAS